jgi:hypothetical protein
MKKLFARTTIALVFALGFPALADDPITPVGKDGKPLNLDFETGTLKDWTAEGSAFAKQPIKGDTVAPRRSDMKSQHQGDYWIGTYERAGDEPTGTLTSVPFKVTHPFASFLIGGGADKGTRVELVEASSGTVFFKASGYNGENLKPMVVDLRQLLGKEIFIRLVDQESLLTRSTPRSSPRKMNCRRPTS